MLSMYGLGLTYKTYFFTVALNATLGSFCLGYGLSQLNSILLNDKTISPSTFSILSLALSIGGILGAYFSFPISDSKGRRFGFFVSDAITILGVILTCIGWEFKNETILILILGRFVTGLSMGLFSYLVPLYCNLYLVREIVPTEISGFLISLHAIMVALGHFIAYTVTTVTLDSSLIYISFCIPALAVSFQAFMLYFFYEFETPSFLWLKNMRSEVLFIQALTVISKLYLVTSASPCSSILSENEEAECAIISLKDVLNDVSLRRSLLDCIILGAFTNLVGINIFLVYYPAYASDLPGFNVDAQTFTIYASYFILSLSIFLTLKSNITSEIGRIRLLRIGSLGMAACFIVLTLGPVYYDLRLYMVLLMIYLFLYQNSIGSIYYIYSSDILIPKSFSISLTFYWVAMLIVDLTMSIGLFQLYESDYLSTVIAGFYAFMCICLYVFCKVRLSETLMWKKEEIEDKLKKRLNSTTHITLTI